MIAPPTIGDDAWIIFTSGSTGTPKGVAVSHRSAAAFVDAEARLFLRDEPIGPGDRVLAGLSVAFDASCEEMWLAWRHGACLVPAPRALVRSGVDLGPWLTARGITIVSTVPTLASLWPAESLENVRLLIFGGEACPPDLAARLAVDGREVWNTYGPTEATVVACAALLDGTDPVRIGLPLDGWDLAVVDADGHPVADGEVGELIIGGVGLARYLDPVKDAEKYAPHAELNWARAYRSGDLVRFDPAGLIFQGRADDQVKVGGGGSSWARSRQHCTTCPASPVPRSRCGRRHPGTRCWSAISPYPMSTASTARPRWPDSAQNSLLHSCRCSPYCRSCRSEPPARSTAPRSRGRSPMSRPDDAGMSPALRRLAEQWEAVLGIPVADPASNFFDLGGGSLAAAQLVALIREADPEFTVAEIYAHPRLGAMADALAARSELPGRSSGAFHEVSPTPVRMQVLQTLLGIPLYVLSGIRWLLYLLTASAILHGFGGFDVLPTVSLWVLIPALIIFATPIGRMAIAVVCARLVLAGLRPGDYPRGGSVHLRLWVAEQAAHLVGAVSLAGAPWISYYARALGARIDRDVDLHTIPPVTGMLTIGAGASIEPEVDLSGYWIDGDTLRVGAIRIGANSSVGARSTLLPGTRIGKRAQIASGSAVFGRVAAGQYWAGSPAQREGSANSWWPETRPAGGRRWVAAYGVSSAMLSLLPVIALGIGAIVVAVAIHGSPTLAEAAGRAFLALIPATLAAGVVFTVLVAVTVRLLSLGIREGTFPVRSRLGWQVWSTERLLDLSRTLLFPIYSSLITPLWLRVLGARVGHDVEASTVLLLPSMTTIRDGAFLADDTMVAGYELGGGWLRIAQVEVGKRAFIGNSGMAAAGHVVPRDGLVAVLSAAPLKSKAGSSWLGSPPVRLRRTVAAADESRTFRPPVHLRVARTLWELCRIIPVFVTCGIGLGVVLTLRRRRKRVGGARGRAAQRHRPADRGGGRRRRQHRREVDLRGPDPRAGASALVVVRLADRGLRHLHRDGRGALVRPAGGRHARAGLVAAQPGREDRPRRVVRDLLAAGSGSRHSRRRIHGESRMRGADAPVP